MANHSYDFLPQREKVVTMMCGIYSDFYLVAMLLFEN